MSEAEFETLMDKLWENLDVSLSEYVRLNGKSFLLLGRGVNIFRIRWKIDEINGRRTQEKIRIEVKFYHLERKIPTLYSNLINYTCLILKKDSNSRQKNFERRRPNH